MRKLVWIAMLVGVPAWAHQMSLLSCEGALQPSPLQRRMAAGIEFVKMRKATRGEVHQLDASEEIVRHSVVNFQRLFDSVKRTFPLKPVSPETTETIRRLVGRMEFAFLGHNVDNDPHAFINQLLGGTRLTEFRTFAIPYGSTLLAFHGRIGADHLRLNENFAREFAIVLPTITNVQNLIGFFDAWVPGSIDEVIKLNRYNLPAVVQTAEQLELYLLTGTTEEVFPPDKMRDRLAPLREKLYGFTMTLEEAETFWRDITAYYLLYKLGEEAQTLEKIETTFRTPGGMDAFFQAALRWIGWEGASIHIPLTIPASAFSIVRLSETQLQSLPDYRPPTRQLTASKPLPKDK